MSEGGVLIAALGLFLTWSAMLVAAVMWVYGKFSDLEKAISLNLSTEAYTRAHDVLKHRVSIIERWASRLNGSVRVNFNSMSEPDFRD